MDLIDIIERSSNRETSLRKRQRKSITRLRKLILALIEDLPISLSDSKDIIAINNPQEADNLISEIMELYNKEGKITYRVHKRYI